MGAFYNEIDPFAAAWLRELIAAGHIAPGIVDERDIRDVRPDELAGFAQCHFFAGIGVWSYALRQAGIPDDYPLWTGSCPCQPFSAAGGRAGFADERHLWPSWFHLIEQCEPVRILGEQVAGGNVDPWFDLVQADLEGMGYAFGLCPVPAAGFGSPNIRERAFWVANATSRGCGIERRALEPRDIRHIDSGCNASGRLADADGWHAGATWEQRSREQRQFAPHGGTSGLADNQGLEGRGRVPERPGQLAARAGSVESIGASPVHGFWRASDWICCTDGKWRPIEPGTFPLADGTPGRVGRLRGYGNAINAEVATAFIEEAFAAIDEITAGERLTHAA